MTSATEWNINTLLQFQYSAVLYSSTKDKEVRNEQDDAQLYKTRRRKFIALLRLDHVRPINSRSSQYSHQSLLALDLSSSRRRACYTATVDWSALPGVLPCRVRMLSNNETSDTDIFPSADTRFVDSIECFDLFDLCLSTRQPWEP
jgi:hypothetical protein